MQESWTNGYVRIPFLDGGRDREGADCWGLPCIIFKERRNIDLPILNDYVNVKERQKLSKIIHQESQSWASVQPGCEIIYDILVFSVGGLPSHVGLVVKPGTMIHCEKGRGTCVVEYRNHLEWSPRLEGIYRYAEGSNIPTAIPNPHHFGDSRGS